MECASRSLIAATIERLEAVLDRHRYEHSDPQHEAERRLLVRNVTNELQTARDALARTAPGRSADIGHRSAIVEYLNAKVKPMPRPKGAAA